ncbi:MAG: CoA transferase [Proteobacteria bacterium]|nr:CoA transferase [Pseudomonadota bacterium]
MKSLPLEGITIASFGWVWAAPHMGRLLADMGARVIKIESQVKMDTIRGLPPFPTSEDGEAILTPNSSAYYSWLNRNKLGVTLNLTTPKGVELAKEIIKISDGMMENYSVGIMAEFGLDYESVKAVKSDIIYVSLSPLGMSGPIKHYMMYGRPQVYMSGLGHISGRPDGPPSSPLSWGDPVAGNGGAFALLSALYYKRKTGKGQFIEMSQLEGMIGLIPEAIMDYTMNGEVQTRQENRHEFKAPHNAYKCKGDLEWVTIGVANDDEWKALCQAMGNPEWADDPKFSDAKSRWNHQEELDGHLEAWTRNHNPYEVTERLQKAGVAAFPVLSNRGLVEDPHLNQRDFFEEWDHPEIGRKKYDGVLWKMSKTPGKIRKPAPMVGQHNDHVFGELLGLPQSEIDRLVEEKVIY